MCSCELNVYFVCISLDVQNSDNHLPANSHIFWLLSCLFLLLLVFPTLLLWLFRRSALIGRLIAGIRVFPFSHWGVVFFVLLFRTSPSFALSSLFQCQKIKRFCQTDWELVLKKLYKDLDVIQMTNNFD